MFVLPLLSAVLLWAAFFPLDLGFLGFVALVPWLALVRADVSRRRRYLAAYLGGVAFYALATQWVRVAHPMMYLSWVGLSLVLPLFWLLALDFIRRFDRLGVPLALSVPVAWVALEYARMHFPTGFPFLKPLGLYQMVGFGWYFLGYTQHAFLPLIQIADVTGVYGVSFVVAAANGAVAGWVWRRTGEPRPQGSGQPDETRSLAVAARPIIPTAAVALLLAASVGYGFVRLSHPEFAPGPRVAAIQGSVPQFEKNVKGESLGLTYGNLHLTARALDPRPDLVVWPETCCPVDWAEVAPGAGAGTVTRDFQLDLELSDKHILGSTWGIPVLLGLNGLEWDGSRGWKYNTALLLHPVPAAERGPAGPPNRRVARYDKMHLVPFGEYVPFRETFPWMKAFTPYTHDYSCRPGESWTRFPLAAADGRAFTFGCLICYEDSDPYLARQYVASEPVDFLVNISNDGWFDGTEEHEQHLAICRFRAVEARRAVVRAVNMGISGVIDPDGRVVAVPGASWSAAKKVEGVVSAVVPIDGRGSWYARLGDWVPAGCWLAVLTGLVAARVRRAA